MEEKEYLRVPTQSIHIIMEENLVMNGETVGHVSTPVMLRAPDNVQLSTSSQFLRAMSPVACFTKSPGNTNVSNVPHSKNVNAAVSQPFRKAATTSGELDSAVERRNMIMTEENLKITSYRERMVAKEKEVLTAAKQQGRPVLRRAKSPSYLGKDPNSTTDVKIVDDLKVFAHSKSTQLEKVDVADMVSNKEERQKEAPKGARSPHSKRVNPVIAMVNCCQKNKKETLIVSVSPQLKRACKLDAMVDSFDKRSLREIRTGARSPKLKKADTLHVLFDSGEKTYKEMNEDPRLSTSQLKRADIPNIKINTREKSGKEIHTEPKSPRSKRTTRVKVIVDNGENGEKEKQASSSCFQLKETNTPDGVVSSVEEEENETNSAPKNSGLKRTNALSGMICYEENSQNEMQADIMKAPKQEEQLLPNEAKLLVSDRSSGNSLTPSSPKLQSTSRSPPLQPERNSSGSTTISNDASPKLNKTRECARLVASNPRIDKHTNLKEQSPGCKGIYKVNRSRSFSEPSAEKLRKENNNDPKKGNIGQRNHNFEICDHVPLSSSQKQTRHLLSFDNVPFQRRSTGDIHQALQACSKGFQPLWDPFEEAESAMGFKVNPRIETSKEQGYDNQMNLAPRVDKRIANRTCASSMSNVYEASDDKAFAGNLTAFTLKTQLAAFHKPVKFREIKELLKKSKWFHALSQICSDGDFSTAMLEIQKQKEREKALREKQPSVAASLEEIRRCRYLRIPEHYQVKSEAFQHSSGDVDSRK